MNAVGTPQFAVPRLPDANRPNAHPLDLAECAWPQAEHSFDTLGLAIEWRPAALGFAIGKAIDLCAPSLDATLLARLVVEHAVPMAMIDPSRFMDRLAQLRANA